MSQRQISTGKRPASVVMRGQMMYPASSLTTTSFIQWTMGDLGLFMRQPLCVNELILNQKKTAPEAVVHALWTAVFLWVGWFISGYGTPVSKTMQPMILCGGIFPWKGVSSQIPSLFLPLSRHRTFLCSLRRTGSSLVETVPTRSTVTGTLTRNVTDVTRRKKMKGIGKKRPT